MEFSLLIERFCERKKTIAKMLWHTLRRVRAREKQNGQKEILDQCRQAHMPIVRVDLLWANPDKLPHKTRGKMYIIEKHWQFINIKLNISYCVYAWNFVYSCEHLRTHTHTCARILMMWYNFGFEFSGYKLWWFFELATEPARKI